MKQSKCVAVLTVVSLALGPMLVLGCSGDPSSRSEQVETGTLDLPLLATTEGTVYKLSNASIDVFGQSTFVRLTATDDPSETVLSTTLPTGSYQASLQPWWTLGKRNAQGAFDPITATLLSSPAVSFRIFNGTAATIVFQFQTDGNIVTMSSGGLNVAIDVVETTPSCRSLGTDCPAGSWCPPTELTGAATACLPAGSIAIGEPCSDPTSCVANASCFDSGADSVCLELCDHFDEPCSSGGVCQALGSTYGACR